MEEEVKSDTDSRINLGIVKNHAPIGDMLRFRTRHQQFQQPGQPYVRGKIPSIYPLGMPNYEGTKLRNA